MSQLACVYTFPQFIKNQPWCVGHIRQYQYKLIFLHALIKIPLCSIKLGYQQYGVVAIFKPKNWPGIVKKVSHNLVSSYTNFFEKDSLPCQRVWVGISKVSSYMLKATQMEIQQITVRFTISSTHRIRDFSYSTCENIFLVIFKF